MMRCKISPMIDQYTPCESMDCMLLFMAISQVAIELCFVSYMKNIADFFSIKQGLYVDMFINLSRDATDILNAEHLTDKHIDGAWWQ